MIVLAMGRGCCGVSVCGAVMQLRSPAVRTLWHGLLLNLRTLAGRRTCCSSYVIQEHGALSNPARGGKASISELENCLLAMSTAPVPMAWRENEQKKLGILPVFSGLGPSGPESHISRDELASVSWALFVIFRYNI